MTIYTTYLYSKAAVPYLWSVDLWLVVCAQGPKKVEKNVVGEIKLVNPLLHCSEC